MVTTEKAEEGKRKHEEFYKLFPSPPWRIEEEICVTRGDIRVCGHPDLYRLFSRTGFVIEYKSVSTLRYEYVLQISAYIALLSYVYRVPFHGALVLNDVVITDADMIPRELTGLAKTAIRVEFDDPRWVLRELFYRATWQTRRPGPWCSYCKHNSICSVYREAKLKIKIDGSWEQRTE